MAEYQYQGLDVDAEEIRILILLPDDNADSNIRCRLVHRSLSTNPSYLALSYTWGNPEPSKSIHLEEDSNTAQIAVGPNLFSALRQFRHKTEDTALWIDALCINQSDTAERNIQVSLMKFIYGKATCVLMWLGEESDDSNLAMNLLSKFGTLMTTLSSTDGSDAMETADSPSLADICGSASFDQHWISLRSLFLRSYWSRVWIIQEVLLARFALVCCGAYRVPWAFVASTVVAAPLFPHHIFSQPARETIVAGYLDLPQSLAQIATDHEEGKVMNVIDGLVLSRQRRATDTRDHIYGILSVINDAGIEPDYSKSMQVLYQDLVGHSIGKEKCLDILTACKRVYLTSSSLPTWAPNWSLYVPESSYLLLYQHQSCHFQTGGLSEPSVSIGNNATALLVQGFRFDEVDIASLTDCSSPTSRPFANLRLDWELWTSTWADKEANVYGNIENQKQAFCTTAVVGRDIEGKKETFAEDGWQVLWEDGLGWVDLEGFSESEKAEREKKMQKLVTRASTGISRGFAVGPRFLSPGRGIWDEAVEIFRKEILSVFFSGEEFPSSFDQV